MSRFGYFSFLANNKKQCRKQTRAGTQPKTSLQSNCGLLSSGVNKASSALKSSNSAFSSSSSSSTSSAGRWRFAYQGGTSCPTVSLFKWTMQSAASLIKQINPKRYMQSLLVAPYGLQVWGIGEAGPSSNGHTKYELVQMAWISFIRFVRFCWLEHGSSRSMMSIYAFHACFTVPPFLLFAHFRNLLGNCQCWSAQSLNQACSSAQYDNAGGANLGYLLHQKNI